MDGEGFAGAGFDAGASRESFAGGIDMTGSGAGAGRTRGVAFGAGNAAGGAPIVVERGAVWGPGIGCSTARLAQPHAGTQLASTIVTASILCGTGPSYRTRDLIRRISPRKPSQRQEIASLADLDRHVESIIATGDPPGISVAVVRSAGTI